MVSTLLIVDFVVMGILIVFLFFAIRGISRVVRSRIKNDFVRQMSYYDTMIEERESRFATLQENFSEYEQKASHQTRSQNDSFSSPSGARVPEFASFSPRALGEDYHLIRKTFSFDREQVLHQVVSQVDANEGMLQKRVQVAKKLVNRFDFATVYDLLTLSTSLQKQTLLSIITKDEAALIREYEQEAGWQGVLGFTQWLNTVCLLGQETIEVTVSMFEQNTFERFKKSFSLKVSYDENLCEGICIKTRGKLYDFGLRMKELA